MSRRFGALVLIVVVAVVSAPLAGFAFGAWTTELKVTGTVTIEDTGLPPGATPAEGVEIFHVGMNDALGVFEMEECQPVHDSWAESRLVDTNDDGIKDTIEFTLPRGYNSYVGRIVVVLENRGSESAEIGSFNLLYPQYPDGRFDQVDVKAVPGDCSHPPGLAVWFTPLDIPMWVEPGEKAFIEGFVSVFQEAANGKHAFAVSWNAS